ncbi:MAG: type II secretion system protein N [Betaproteobacteria bacterium]
MTLARDRQSSSATDVARWPWSWRLAQWVATLLAGAVLASVLAHWGWQWWGPPATTAPPIAVNTTSLPAAIAAAPWFGNATPAGGAVAPASTIDTATNAGDGRLLGVIAGRDGDGYALLRLPERGPVLVRKGQEITAGVLLEAVTPAGIRLRDRGELREMLLRPTTGALSAAPAKAAPTRAASAPPAVGTAAACTPPAGGAAPFYRLNAELLTGIAAKPDSWSTAFSASPSGLTVREGNAFAAMLGMKPGDRVTEANGIALGGTEDVLVAVIKPLLASQAVRVTGLRDGKPVAWVFVNAGACP